MKMQKIPAGKKFWGSTEEMLECSVVNIST